MAEKKRTIVKPKNLPVPDADFSPAVRYGDWVFTSAMMATDYKNGLLPEVIGNSEVPLMGDDKYIREAKAIFRGLEAVLKEVGSDLNQGVRLDQFPTVRAMMDPYQATRTEIMKPPRPGSQSVNVDALLCPQANIQVELVAIVPGKSLTREGISSDQIPGLPKPLGGFTPVIKVGDYVFPAAQIATDWATGGLAPEARATPFHWGDNQIEKETRFTLKNFALALEAAGSSLENVVKTTIYLTDLKLLPRLDRVWREFFPKDPPTRIVYPVTSLGLSDITVEIGMVAVTNNGKVKKEIISSPKARKRVFHESQAVRAGDFLFISGLMAGDEAGLAAAVRRNPAYPYGSHAAAAQMRDIMEQASALCKAAGTSISNAVRMLTVHTDLAEYQSAYDVRKEYFTDGLPASTTIKVPGPLVIPGCTIATDLWVAMSP